MTKGYLFFLHENGLNGWLSNWYPAAFTVDGVAYRDTEQYFMAQKALRFGDGVCYKKIMEATDPAIYKRLGRQVSNFDSAVWDAERYEIMKTANREKFRQNPELLSALLSTGDAVLLEANPGDPVWGVALDAAAAAETAPDAFPGRNLQGKLLMELREEFRTEG